MTAYTNHHLTAEHVNDKSGPAVMLTQQERIADAETIIIRPWQLVAACQHLGLTASDPKAAQDIATLQRRMLALRDRIDSLADWMEKFSDHKHADLTYEMTQLHAMQDLASEWCFDFEDEFTPASDTMKDKKQAVATQLADKKASPDIDTRQMAMEV